MSLRANTIFVVSVTAILVGLALAENPRCRGACQRLAQDVYTYGLRTFFRTMGF